MSVLMESSYFTLQQVAERLQVSEMTVRRWVTRGELPAIKLGQQWRIRDDDLREFLEARRKSPNEPRRTEPNSPRPEDTRFVEPPQEQEDSDA